MGLDIRWPIGLMFSLIGAILVVSGLVTSSNAEMYHRSLDININLIWGLVLLVFGGWMLAMAWRGRAAEKVAEQKPAENRVQNTASRR
jgi:protein-S-isoprenylcysteine O-methyltransferase Ste14